MKKIIGIFALSALLFACDTTDETSLSGRTDTIYVVDTDNSVINITNESVQAATFDVNVSYSTTSDRTFQLTVDNSSDAIESTYTIDTATLKIPANELSGTVTINGNYDSSIQPSTGTETLVLNLSGMEGLQTTNPAIASQIAVTINRSCVNPDVIAGDFYVGDYTIEDVDAILGPGNGSANFANETVTLTVDGTNPNQRNFDVTLFPGLFDAPETMSIELSTSGEVIAGEIVTTLSCDGTNDYAYENAGTADNSIWAVCDGDSSITVFYAEDAQGSCGGPFLSSFRLTKN
jgi:hypothetical protein